MEWQIHWDDADVVIVGPGSLEVVLRDFNHTKLQTVGLQSNVLDALGGLASLEPTLPETMGPLAPSHPERRMRQCGWRYTDAKIDLQCISTWRDGVPDHGRDNILWVGECVSWAIDTATFRAIDTFFRQQRVRSVSSQTRDPRRGDD